MSDPTSPQSILQLAEKTAEPSAVAVRIDDFRNSHQQRPEWLSLLERCLADPQWSARLVTAFGNSAYLSHLIHRWPEFLQELVEQPQGLTPEQELTRLLDGMLATDNRSEAAKQLRLFKQRRYLAIGLRDLSGEASLEETTQAISHVADCTLEAAYRWLDRWLGRRHGEPFTESTTGLQRSRFVILGMGKLGGRELNFSSDIDLIFLYDEDKGHTQGDHPLPIKSYYIRLGQELMKLMQETTPEGMVFRVDLRLRPDGESGDLCLSCRSAEIYYEAYGQTWERAAMIKARAVAGDLTMGEAFLQRLRPFIFRRYLDFGALDAIRRMKRKIDRKISQNSQKGHNVKLGRGGIREIEFFVQAQQLIHGGREASLRQRTTLPTLAELHRLGFVDGGSARFLEEAYRFLRMVEHRLQIYREQQLHTLPEEAEELRRVARRAGFADAAAFMARIQRITDGVHQIYGNLFFESERRSHPGEDLDALLECDPTQEQCLAHLHALGFQDPVQARGLFTLLREGPPGANLTENGRKWYDLLAAPLLREIRDAPDQDLAIRHGEAFLKAVGRRTNYLALLVENPPVLKLLVRLFGISRFLSRFFNQNPSLMDSLVSPGFLDHYRNKGELGQDLARLMEESRDPEERMRLIREFKNTELLRIGLRDISAIADPAEVMAGLAALADAILTQTMINALTELEERYGIPTWSGGDGQRHRGEFAILAMGKLGGAELNYASDLDLIFVHASHGENQVTDGERSIPNAQFFTKLGQKIITALTTFSHGGKLYELDMRLRPSGNSGALVISLDSFAHYQRHEAWTWEHQALTRARVVTGNPGLVAALKQEIATILAIPRDPRQLATQVWEMRERMYREKKPPADCLDIKQSRGGIVDVEFLCQYLILAHGASQPRIIRPNLPAALLAMKNAGLLSIDQYQILDEAYRWYRLVENRLRLLHDRSENRLGDDDKSLKRLARLCSLGENEPLRPLLLHHFDQVYPIFQQILALPPPDETA